MTFDYARAQEWLYDWGPRILIALLILVVAHFTAKAMKWAIAKGVDRLPFFARRDNARPGGKFPVNTNGGGLSFSHSGMYGMMLLVEAQRQLAGTAEEPGTGLPGRQTKAKTAVVNGTGGSLSTTGTIVLKADS